MLNVCGNVSTLCLRKYEDFRSCVIPVAQIRRHDLKSKIVPWIVVRNNRDLPTFASSYTCFTVSQILLVIAAAGAFHFNRALATCASLGHYA
jgi:hypothetical protein